MSDSGFAVQGALYTALTEAVEFPVYDSVPEETSLPYLVIDTVDTTPSDYMSSAKNRWLFYLSIWSDQDGKVEIYNAVEVVKAALHRKRLHLTTGRMILCQVRRWSVEHMRDESAYVGTLTVEIWTE